MRTTAPQPVRCARDLDGDNRLRDDQGVPEGGARDRAVDQDRGQDLSDAAARRDGPLNQGSPRYRAVLLDFRGILVHEHPSEWWVTHALERAGRSPVPEDVERFAAALAEISDLPGYDEDQDRIDTSLEVNREITLRWLSAVGFDEELAEALWSFDCEPEAWPVYPDASEVVRSIRAAGCATALVSDFHVDLRPHLLEHGVELDAY